MSVLLLADGLHPDNDTARRWVNDELSKPQYHEQATTPSQPPEPSRNFFSILYDFFTGGPAPDTTLIVTIVVVLLVIIALVAFAIFFVRRTPRARRTEKSAPLDDLTLKSGEYRSAAEDLLDKGDPDGCVREAMRALARRGIERGYIVAAPSLTAREASRRLGVAYDDKRDQLRWAADLFDAVEYGYRHADLPQAQAMLELERSIRRGRARSDADHDSVGGGKMSGDMTSGDITSGDMTNDDVAAGR